MTPRPSAPAPSAVGERQVSFIIDPSMYAEASALPGFVYGHIDRAVRTDLHYHYSGPICAQRWLDVCDDPAYGHDDLVRAVTQSCPALVASLREGSGGLGRVAMASLGPGDGSLDEQILRGIAGDLQVESYAGFDFSFDLLRRAVHRIAHAEGLRGSFPITAVCGDFTRLAPVRVPATKGCARLFTLTGLTIGNYREDALLTDLRALLSRGDYLLLDARMHRLGPNPVADPHSANLKQLLTSYDLASVRRFAFGPVEMATLASAEDVVIGFEVSQGITTVPGGLNVVIYCSDLDTRMRLGDAPVTRERLDLAVTTMYHGPSLSAWLQSAGFSLVWQREAGSLGLFLLQRD